MVEASEPVAGAFDLLDDQVQRFGGSVRCAGRTVVEDLCPPSGEGAAEGSDLGDVVSEAGDDGFVDEGGGVGGVVDEVDVTHRFFGQPGAGDFVVGKSSKAAVSCSTIWVPSTSSPADSEAKT